MMIAAGVTKSVVRGRFVRAASRLSSFLGGALGVVVVLAATPVARAQVKDVSPYAAVVTADNTPLRCGDGLYYRVADLTRGQVVQVDAESAGWSRVAYPSGTPAYVKSDDASADEAAGTVRLKAPSALKAVHVAAGFTASWKALLTTPAAEGTSLKWLETVKENGAVVGYKVVAPAGAKGFVENKALRKATAEEAARVGLSAAPISEAPKPVAASPEKETGKPGTPTVTMLADPIVPGNSTGQPSTITGSSPTAAQPGTPSTTTPTSVPALETPDPKKPLRVGTVEQLESAFQIALHQPASEQAELDALLVEFNRAIDNAGSAPEKDFHRKQLERRRDALKLIRDTREGRLAIDRAQQDVDERGKQVNKRIAELEAQRVYTIIGLLVPSTVYDGKRLPLMYRLQSVGSASPTTIGYLRPTETLQLQSKVGLVVGVVGDASIDRSLMLNIIAPTRVDTLQAAGGQVPPQSLASPTVAPANPSAAADEPGQH